MRRAKVDLKRERERETARDKGEKVKILIVHLEYMYVGIKYKEILKETLAIKLDLLL